MTANAITLFCFWHLFPSTITSTGKGDNSSYWKPRKLWSRDGQLKDSVDGQLILLMEGILQHLGCIESCKYWDKLAIHWCRISSINSSIFPGALKLGSTVTTSLGDPLLNGAIWVAYQRNGAWKFSWLAGSKGEMSINGLLQQKSTKRFLKQKHCVFNKLNNNHKQNHNSWKTTKNKKKQPPPQPQPQPKSEITTVVVVVAVVVVVVDAFQKGKTSQRLPDGPFGAAWRTLAVQRITLAESPLRHRWRLGAGDSTRCPWRGSPVPSKNL